MNVRKNTSRSKLKAASQEEKLTSGKNFSRICSAPDIIDKTIQNIIKEKLNIKLEQFMEDELDAILKKKFKTVKLQALTKYPQKFG